MISHLKLRHVVGIILFSFLSLKTYAQTYQLKGDYFVRSSLDFLSSENKIGVLHEGSTFRVVNRTPQRNGAEALEIEVTAMTADSYVKPSTSGRIFIYKANSSHFVDRTGSASSTFESGVAKCTTCTEATASSNNQMNLGKLADEVAIVANQAPKASAKPEEIKPLVGPLQKGSLDSQIKNYSDSAEVERMISWAMKNKSAASKGKCYRKVKEALAYKCGPSTKNYSCRNPFAPKGGRWGEGNNLISEVPTAANDVAALTAKEKLKQYGFKNLLEIEPYKSQIKTPSLAPKGAILVYSSGIPCSGTRISDCGHTEIKTDVEGKPGYVSDYYSADAINETPRARKYGSNYKLVGVMIKPKE